MPDAFDDSTRAVCGVLLATAAISPATAADSLLGSTERLPYFDRLLLLDSTSDTAVHVSIGDIEHDREHDIAIAKGRRPTGSWGFLGRKLVLVGVAKPEVPALKSLLQIADQNVHSNLEKQVGATLRPTHLLFLYEPL